MLTVGLIGFGFAGKVFHAPVIRAVEGLHLTTIVQRHGDPDPRYSDVEFVRSVDALLMRPIDLVVVATPNTSHHPLAKQCLLAGRHVVVDKPFTTSVSGYVMAPNVGPHCPTWIWAGWLAPAGSPTTVMTTVTLPLTSVSTAVPVSPELFSAAS
jgi:hypothetical protein